MTRKLYEHERHPLDIAHEEETKVQERKHKKISDIVQKKLAEPKDNWTLNQLEYFITQHLGLDYLFTGTKLRQKAGWPVTREEMINFLEEKGLKE